MSDMINNPDQIEISSELASVLDMNEDIVVDDIKQSMVEEIEKQKIRMTVENLQHQYPSQVMIPEELFPKFVEDEEFIKLKAAQLYKNLDTKSAKYLKIWCQVNDFIQIWATPKKSELQKKLQYSSEFTPQEYMIKMQHKVDDSKDFVLIDRMPTAAEARIQGAKNIGFLDSLEYKAAIKDVPPKTMEILTKDRKYLANLKVLHTFNEYRNQIEKARFVPLNIKQKWSLDLERRIQESREIV